ncbi:hypothetical protein ACFODL_05915 [Phenylobacterium terrae]|uniref:Uncharacterized protein n=1 Tax=Phenylobacterium terrae TaxID=2665495 RepID=A0ABW4N5N0_9CAUL
MRRAMLTGMLMAATALATQPALAQEAIGPGEDSPFGGDVYPMNTTELEAERGGLMTPFGEINFGAVLRTIIDGKVALETQLVWTPTGPVQSVISNVSNVVQNVQSGLNITPDAGATNGALQGTGTPPLKDMPGMDLTQQNLNTGLNQAVDKTGDVTPTGGDALSLAGQFVPPSNPTIDSLIDAAQGLTGGDLPKPPAPPNPPAGGGGSALTGATDLAGGVLDIDATGTPGEIVKQVTQTTPPTTDDPIGDLVVASTTNGQTPQQVIQAAAALGIDLSAINGGNAMVLAGEDGGGTAILHNISETGLSNILLNTANNQDIRIETDITLVMPGLEAFQQDILSQNLQLDLFDAIGNALTNALP